MKGKNEEGKKKEGHFFLTFFLHSFLGSSRCALFFLSPICVSFVVQSSSSFPNNTREPSQREWTQHCSTPSRVTFCGTSNRVCVLSLSLSLERERERGDSTHPERSACVPPFIEWSRRVEFLQNRGRVRPIESSTTAALLMRETRKASFIYVVARR